MTVKDADTLKSYFNLTKVPVPSNYVDLIDTLFAQGAGGSGGDHNHDDRYVQLTIANNISAVHTFDPSTYAAPFILGSNAQGQTIIGLKADQLNKSVIAGNGLTGGGTLTSDATLSLTTPGTLSISSTNNASGSHTHTITTSSNPGASAAILSSTSAGKLTLQAMDIRGTGVDHQIILGSDQTRPIIMQHLDLLGDGSIGVMRFIADRYHFDAQYVVYTNNVYMVGSQYYSSNNAYISGNRLYFYSSDNGYYTSYICNPLTSNNALGFFVNNEESVRIDSTGYLKIFKGSIVFDNSVATGSISFASGATPDMTLYNSVTISSGGVLKVSNAKFTSIEDAGGGSNDITIAPAGDIQLNPTGNDVLPYANYDINLGAINKKYLTLHAAELWVETLVAQNTIATIGGRILIGPTTVLTSDLPLANTTIYVKHNEMAVNDIVYMEADGKVEFFQITAGPNGTGPYSYTVTRNLDGSGANDWYAGDAIFNTGTTDEGFIDLYSIRGVKEATDYGPTIVGNVRSNLTYNNWIEHWAIGNLNGLYGYGTNTYGFAAGKYADDKSFITADATNGIRIQKRASSVNTVIAQWAIDGTITIGQVAASQNNINISSGALLIRNNTTELISLTAAGIVTVGQVAASQNNVYISSGALSIRNNTTDQISLTAAGIITIGPVGSSLNNVYISSGAISIRNNTTERIGMTAAGILTIKDSSGSAVFTFNSTAGAEFTLPLTLASTGGIYQGTGTFASPTTGLKLWNDTGIGRIAGYNGGTIQWYGSTDGKFYAGAGALTLANDGLTINYGTSDSNKIKFYKTSSPGIGVIGEIYAGDDSVGGSNGKMLVIKHNNPVDYDGVEIQAAAGTTFFLETGVYNLDGGFHVPSSGGIAIYDSASAPGSMSATPGEFSIYSSPVAKAVMLNTAGDGRFSGGLYVGSTDTDPAAGTITTTESINVGGGINIGTESAAGDGNIRMSGSIAASLAVGACVANTASQSINNNSNTAIIFDGEYWDPIGMHDPVTNNTRIKAPVAGRYLLAVSVRWATNSTGIRQLYFYQNSASMIVSAVQNAASSGATDQTLIGITDMAINDYVECYAYQNSGGSLNIEHQHYYSANFTMIRIA